MPSSALLLEERFDSTQIHFCSLVGFDCKGGFAPPVSDANALLPCVSHHLHASSGVPGAGSSRASARGRPGITAADVRTSRAWTLASHRCHSRILECFLYNRACIACRTA